MPTPAKKPVKTFTSWSFSRWSDWFACPLRAKLKHLDKVPEPGSPAMDRGIQIHQYAEQYVKGQLPRLPKELALFKDDFADLRRRYKAKQEPMIVEDQWAFTSSWDETQWDNWNNCWLRVKIDLAFYEGPVLRKIDWKTGKYSPYKVEEYNTQLELYALVALLMSERPDVEVRPAIGWLDEGHYTYPSKEVYVRADIAPLKRTWEKRVKPMMLDVRFPPKPSQACRWCFYGQSGKAKGGPGICKF